MNTPTPQAALVEALAEAEDYLRHCANSPALADRCRAALAQAEAAQPVAPEWLPVVRAVHQQFRLYSERMPDGFDSRVFRWVADLLAAPQPAEAAPKQEAVAEVRESAPVDPTGRTVKAAFLLDCSLPAGTLLFSQPQQPAPEPVARVPLTDEQIKALHNELCDSVGSDYRTIARAVELAHGIAAPQTPAGEKL